MRLAVLPLSLKLQSYSPQIACFVGKKIWDIYESVISKSAGAPQPARDEQADLQVVKEEVVKVEEEEMDVKLESLDTAPALGGRGESTSSPSPRKVKAKTKAKSEPFDWTTPRPFRLPGRPGSPRGTYTYFWVVPNTSGLERTQVGPR